VQGAIVRKIVIKSSSSSTELNPFTLVMIAVTLAGAVFGLNQISPWFMPLLAIASFAVIGFVAYRQLEAARAQAAATDYAQLAATDFLRYAPWFKENIRGQDEVIDSITSAVQGNLSLARPGQTLGAFFLVGPTGTGKTFLAQLVSQALYPDSEPVLLRMNQYKQAEDVMTLLGPPPGSPGYEVGGSLTRPVLENPRRVIIFDELEKAHKDLQHCLYDVLDTASCREKSSGRQVDFSSCVFFATCNSGVEALRALRATPAGRDPITWLGASRDALVDAGGFDRAFLARWTDILLMDELPPIHVAEVVCLQLQKHWRDYGIEVRHAAPELILQAVVRNEEFKQYGVRQLGAYVQMKTSAAIAQARTTGCKAVDLVVDARGNLSIVPVPS
jgi:ATP-dependent Clp protease ATP-binding subunit ClpC